YSIQPRTVAALQDAIDTARRESSCDHAYTSSGKQLLRLQRNTDQRAGHALQGVRRRKAVAAAGSRDPVRRFCGLAEKMATKRSSGAATRLLERKTRRRARSIDAAH